jgi:glycerol-3-phosphate dehydrogenase subunit C
LPVYDSPDLSVDFCSGCRVCNLACPTGVKIAEINARARASMVQKGRFSFLTRLRNNILGRSEVIGKIGQPVAPLGNALLSNRFLRMVIETTLHIHRDAPLPAFARERFSTWYTRRQKRLRATSKVVYFHGCATEYYEPWVGKAAVGVLEANGFEVLVPRQNCCGLPLLSNGEFAPARKYHRSNALQLVPYARQGIPIIGTSTSCTLTLKEEAIELLDLVDGDSRTLAENTYDIHEFLRDLLAEDRLNQDFFPIFRKVPYHAPCQYRAHRIGTPAYDLLSLITGLQIAESHVPCCGVAGTYGYKTEKYQIAQDVGAPLFDFVKNVDSPVVVCDSETCRWQITHATGLLSIHPIELIAAAYGLEIDGPLRLHFPA